MHEEASMAQEIIGRRTWGRAQREMLNALGAYALLTAMALVIGLPFFWMLSASLKPLEEVFNFAQILPSSLQWQNYTRAWAKAPFGRYLFNSAFSSVCILVGQYLTIIPAAYGFARLRFPGRDVLFVLVLATMMVPI